MPLSRATVALALAALLAAGAAAEEFPATARAGVSPASATSGIAHTDSIRDSEYWLDQYGIRAAWRTTRGAGQTIAIIDSGIDATHPDLAGAVVGGADFSGLGATNGATPVGSGEDAWHGTLVASLAAARGTGGTNGVIGAAPAASLLSLSIGYQQGSATSDEQIAKAVRWAVDHGATVINLSLTRNTPDWPTSWDDAFLYAEQHNVVVVAAAGNRASGTDEVGAPATMPGVVAVGGVARDGTSSTGASSQGITIAVSAPSEQLVGDLPGDRFASWSGTSGASPIVAGIVALVRAAHPELDAANIVQRLVATAKDEGAPGRDYLYGYGLVNAAAAVSASVPAVTVNPLGTMKQWIATYRPAAATVAPTAVPHAAPRTRSAPGWSPVGVLLPSPVALELWGLPALAVAAILAVWIALIAVGLRGVRSARLGRRDDRDSLDQ